LNNKKESLVAAALFVFVLIHLVVFAVAAEREIIERPI